MNSRGVLAFLMSAVAVLGVLLAVLIFYAGEVYEYQDTLDGASLPETDVIVCLAGGRGRIALAGDLWYRYWEAAQKSPESRVPILYISGAGRGIDFQHISKRVRPGVEPYLKPEFVFVENESADTEQNASWFGRIARQQGWRRLILVTSSYHMRRAKRLFERLLPLEGVDGAVIDTFSLYNEPFEAGEWRTSLHGIRVTVMEYLKELSE